MASWLIGYPFDVVKSRLQVKVLGQQTSTVGLAVLIARTEGKSPNIRQSTNADLMLVQHRNRLAKINQRWKYVSCFWGMCLKHTRYLGKVLV